ncbi:DUF1642 domain-containing protein [Lactobacillus paracasei subsp. paracasei]|uniref:DUF1642 domain-containing protein n=1 Tax=Lacticaseibacillus paracasei TaxID=1597 RepID=UPI0018C59007|nr:DUF1642 domain-containing protein [Lacticaseibacillus paracasei]MBG1272283.1 DUF1642 domain-containing protein [Lacticaseibacillus paracasei subsp. paracasei]
MSEEKLYAVKNTKGLYLSMSAYTLHRRREGLVDATTSQRTARELCTEYGGHIVTLIEEPKKAVLTKEQAEIVERAHDCDNPAGCISGEPYEELLINAYVNGYTVAKEKKYNVKVPYADYKWYVKTPDGKLDTLWVKGLAKGFGGYPDGIELTNDDIENFGLQDCEKEEVTDDEQ